jgi:hypothetical protein
MEQQQNSPVEGQIVGFAGAPAPQGQHGYPVAWAQPYYPPAQVTPPTSSSGPRRKRWVPVALGGAGLVLLLGGGGIGYAIGHSTAPSAETSQLVPGTDGSQGDMGQFGTPPDMSGGFGGQLGQQGTVPDQGTTDQGTTSSDTGTGTGTTT